MEGYNFVEIKPYPNPTRSICQTIGPVEYWVEGVNVKV